MNHPSGKGKPVRVKPHPRPMTAAQRLRLQQIRAEVEGMERKLFPEGGAADG